MSEWLQRRAATVIGAAMIAAAFVAMLIWSWGTWPDVLVDFGREIYLPWQITEGRVLHRDLATFFGPLSPYLNAAFFAAFGVSLRTMALANAAIAAAVVWMLYLMLRQIGGRVSAVAGCLAFIAIFCFGQAVAIGNYNFICPYSHEMTHGLALSLATLLCLAMYLQRGEIAWVICAGLLWGLTFLTKPELFAALSAGVVAFWAAALWMRPPIGAKYVGSMLVFVIAGAVAVVAAFILLWTAMPAEVALKGVLGSWPHLSNAELFRMPFHEVAMGLDDVPGNFVLLLKWLCIWLAAIAVMAALAWAFKATDENRRLRSIAALVMVAAVAALFWLTRHSAEWFHVARPLPVAMLVALLWLAAVALRGRGRGIDVRLVMCLAFATFGLALLGKIILNVRMHHYGFVLAAPTTLVAIAALVDWIPQWLHRRQRSGNIFRAGALALIAAVAAIYLMRDHQLWQRKTHVVGTGADTFRSSLRGAAVQHAVDWLGKILRPSDTLAVIPEGVLINYLTRTPNPTPYWSFMPFEMTVFDEQACLDSLRASPPSFVVLVHRPIDEYSAALYGVERGRMLMQWVRENYRQVYLFADQPFQPDTEFGIAILQRAGNAP